MDTLNAMSPAQTQAWDKWLEAEYSELYWRYKAASLSRIVTGLNVAAGLAGTSALFLIVADHPLATKLVALVAAAVALVTSYSPVGADLEKAKNLNRFYGGLASRYEQTWLRSQQGVYQDVTFEELEALVFQESLAPEPPSGEYDDRLRERVYQILVKSKGLPV
jgi:hypothetical protein